MSRLGEDLRRRVELVARGVVALVTMIARVLEWLH